MREILFRGKRIDNGEWVEGYISEHTICGEDTRIETVIEVKPEHIYDWETYVIIPETVGQFTGLLDKNGKRIFEGDIVKLPLCNEIVGMVEMAYMRFEAQIDNEGHKVTAHCKSNYLDDWENGKYCLREPKCFKIIGNIHDNPELLKE